MTEVSDTPDSHHSKKSIGGEPRRKRLADWVDRFNLAENVVKATPFHWEASNCGHAMVVISEAVSGEESPLRPYCEGFSDYKGYRKALKADGFDDMVSVMRAHRDEISVAMAQRGDLCVIEYSGDQHGGWISGNFAVARTEEGIIHLPRSSAIAAFAI